MLEYDRRQITERYRRRISFCEYIASLDETLLF